MPLLRDRGERGRVSRVMVGALLRRGADIVTPAGVAHISGKRAGGNMAGGMITGLAAVYGITAVAVMQLLPVPRRADLAVAVPLLVWAAVTDLRRREVSDACSAGLALIGLALLPFQAMPLWHVISAAGITAVLWGGSEVFYRLRGAEALGLGDVKLIGAGALVLGPVGLWLLLITAPVGGIAYALVSGRRVLPHQ